MARARTLKNIENVTCSLHFWHVISIRYAVIEDKSLDDQINSKLSGSSIYRKRNMANSDDR